MTAALKTLPNPPFAKMAGHVLLVVSGVRKFLAWDARRWLTAES